MDNYKPISPNKFNGAQKILSSDRIIIHAKGDSLFLFGKQSVGISTAGSFHIDSKKEAIINSPQIYLGLNANEPLLLGNEWEKIMNELINKLTSPQPLVDGTTGIMLPNRIAEIKSIIGKLKNALSKQNKTL